MLRRIKRSLDFSSTVNQPRLVGKRFGFQILIGTGIAKCGWIRKKRNGNGFERKREKLIHRDG